MNNDLKTNLDQITNLISELKNGEISPERTDEVMQSLALLTQSLMSEQLKLQKLPDVNVENLKHDASLYFDGNFTVMRYTGAFKNIFGNSKQKIMPKLDEIFEPGAIEVIKEKVAELQHTNQPQTLESQVISKNGILLPVNVYLEKIVLGNQQELIAAGIIFSGRNPGDLKDYQEILIENLPDMDVYLFDTNFRYILAGGREKERFKLSNSFFTGKTLFQVYDESTQKRLYPFYRNALDGKSSEGEVRIYDEIYFISSTPVRDLSNEVVGGALIAHNVSKEKEVEKNLITAKKEAEEADQAKSLFLAKLSHEIRTPLNAIIGFTDLLKKTELTEKQEKYRHLINESSEHLLSVVNEIIFLFKLNMGKVFIENVPVNVPQLIRNLHDSLILKVKEKGLKTNVFIEHSVPELLTGDAVRLKQIISNLLTNAIKFTDTGGISISVTTENKDEERIFLRFDVHDTGMGIEKEDLHRIFDEFAQTDLNINQSGKGIGLGLNITKKLVELLSGRIQVESRPHKGSTFSVIIPFWFSTSDGLRKEKDYKIEFALLKGKKVLFADDDENNILLAESILGDWGTDFEIARNGLEALERLRATKFDLALLDIHMPVFSGMEVVEKIRNEPNNLNRDTKIIAVTANILRSDINKYLEKGFNNYVLKPFREKGLYNTICNVLFKDDNLSVKLPEPETPSAASAGDQIIFDTSPLLQNASGNTEFFNKMINTFVENTKITIQEFESGLKNQNWAFIGEKAHKAIPSFKYFGLTPVVENLNKLENKILREKEYDNLEEPVKELINDLKQVTDIASRSLLEDEIH